MDVSFGNSYCFDDILMEPLYSNISSRSVISLETNIGSNGRNLVLKTPLISSPMDTVTEKEMAIKMALNGGLGIIHRYMDIEEQVLHIIKVKRFLQYIIQEPYCIIPTDTYDNIIKLSEQYNVSSFCVVSSLESNDLIGIITRRDIEYMKYYINNNINNNMTPNMTPNIEFTVYDIIKHKNIIIKPLDNNTQPPLDNTQPPLDNHTNTIIKLESCNLYSLDNTLKTAKALMLQHRIEKIPIVSGSKLAGLITLNNINHYENNKSKACIDKNGALCVGAAIGITGDYLIRLDKLMNAGVNLICIDVANGFNENVFNAVKVIRAKYPDIVLMVGNVCNWQGYEALSKYDVDCIRVGVGNGSICSTRLETGIGKGQFSAVLECYRYKLANNSQPNIICDGGSLGKTGNKVKALACGSSAIMLGRTLSSTEESPGQIIVRNGKRFKYIRGMASSMANISKQEKLSIGNTSNKLTTNFTAEGVDGEQELSGSVSELLEQINGGIKSGLSYLGCENIVQLHNKSATHKIKFNVVTSIGMSETGIRVKTY